MLNRLSTKLKLQGLLLAVSLGSILVVGYLAWERSRTALKETILNNLTSVRESKADQVEAYFNNLRKQIATLSEDGTVVAAMEQFNQGFDKLNQAEEELPPEANTAIARFYQEQFFPRLAPNIDGEPELESYRPQSKAARYLQYHYLAKNNKSLEEKQTVINAQDGSDYSKTHVQYHKFFLGLRERFGYEDMFLIDFQSGDIVYTAYKGADFATNLNSGPYSQSGLAEIVQQVRSNSDRGSVQIFDFELYKPSYMYPAAFVATPIYKGTTLVGILALELPIEQVIEIIAEDTAVEATETEEEAETATPEVAAAEEATTAESEEASPETPEAEEETSETEEEEEVATTRETYLVGPDSLMRSNARLLMQDPVQYFKTLKANNAEERTIELIENQETSILLQKVDTPAAEEAIAREEGTKVIENYLGESVLSSYAPLNIEGVDWAILSEMSAEEAFKPLNDLERSLLTSTVILMLLVSAFSIFAAGRLLKPVEILLDGVRRIVAGEKGAKVNLDSEDEFGQLARSFNELEEGLEEKNELLARKNRENQTLLLNILPSSVAARLQKGEDAIADEIERAAILVARLGGLEALAAQKGKAEAFALFNEFVEALDGATEKYDVERLKAIGDRYMAACGVATKRLDHTKRLADFALESLKILQGLNNRHNTNLSLTIGIDTGPVMAGLVGSEKFMYYNVWGATVDTANALSDLATPDAILVTQEAYNYLREMYTFEPAQPLQLPGKGEQQVWALSQESPVTSDQ